ncbi:TD and POZ domain-containing protein 2-like [Phymastichus coffea]|uniref:TD and POZ domain-containing protein 2-like n=1 Tax=Phymastichus coffea TaxID=108790 RepID=UPI00273B7BD9|nr:TD and POZ domain-containing protein 2-like [Phymastichus coffea]
MSRTGVIRMPVAELARNQNVLTIERDQQENFIKGKQRVKIDRFPHEEVDFTLSFTNEPSSPSALKPCHCNFRRDSCTCDYAPGGNHDVVYFKLDLRFQNYLHEMSHDYKYRITCNMRLKIGKQQQVCSFDEIRIAKSMTFFVNSDHHMDCILNDLSGALITVEIDRFCIRPDFSFNKIQNDFRALLDNPVHSDVTLKVGDVSIKAHKNILSCRSIVFQAMFNCEMTENQTGIVNIVDVSPKVMQELLCYIYTGRSNNLDKMPVELFEAAAKYQLNDLKTECIEFLIFHVNPENIVELSKLVEMYAVEELTEKISAFMKKYKRIVRNTNLTI